VVPDDSHYQPSLALAAVAKYLRRPEVIESPIKNNVLPFAGRDIPVIGDNKVLINYIGSPGSTGGIAKFQNISFVDVINDATDSTIFQDKIVIIGSTASGLGDTFWTPAGLMMNGVEVHASAIHTILTGNFQKPASSAVTIMLILVLALLCGLLVLRLRALWSLLSMVTFLILYFLMAFSFFDRGIMLDMLYPPLTIVSVFVGINLYNVASERAERIKVTDTFGRYVSPSVVGKILTTLDEGELKLGGDEYEVTVVFADIRGFTSISEMVPPKELVRALNLYLSEVVKAVLKHEGMVNKFGGDSVMAVWNVPVACEGHALLATKAAVNVQRAIGELQEKETSIAKMGFGIGINTGKAVAGNMGAEDRLEYSVIGDIVNTAARIANAAPAGKIWIGVNTYAQVKDYVRVEPLGSLSIRGKREPIEAYEVVDILT
jgi:adenylate cyclase